MYSVYAKCTPWEYSMKEAQSCLQRAFFRRLGQRAVTGRMTTQFLSKETR